MVQHLDRFLVEVSPAGNGKVHFVSSFHTSESAPPGRPGEFDLGIGGNFYHQDEHGLLTFVVEEIKQTGVVLRYESTFDHRSFGKDLVTRDEGEIEVPYRPRSGR